MSLHAFALFIATTTPVVEPSASEETVTPVPTDEERAAEHITRADALFAEQRYAEALQEIERADALFPHRDYAFMRGMIYAEQGDCAAAIAAFEAFVEQDPPAIDAADAKQRIAACSEPESEPVAPPPPSSVPVVSPEVPEPAEPPLSPVRPPDPWYRDVPGGVMAGVGLAGLGVGAAVMGVRRAEGESAYFDRYSEYVRHKDRQRRLEVIGVPILAASSAVLTGAIVRYVVVARRNKGLVGTLSSR